MLLHCFLEKLQSSLLIPRLRHEALQDLAFVIDSAPEIASLAVDLHEHLVVQFPV